MGKHKQQESGGLKISPFVGYHSMFSSAPVELSIPEVKARYAPPLTLGTPEDVREACDSQLENCGVYTLLQHSFALGQMPQAQFLGYSILQQISQNGLIRACIETTADDMVRNWIEFKREGEGTQEGAEEILPEITAEFERLKLRKLLHDAACYVGYMGGCLIYIDTGESDPEALRMPLNISSMSAELRADRPLRFVVIDPINVFPGLYNSTNPLRQDYFTPKTWWVLGQEIHASRLIRLAANEVPTLLKPAYNFFGIAQAQILWDYVMHFQECRVASQRLLSKFSLTVMKTDLTNTLLQQGGLDEIDKRVMLLVRNRSNDGIEVIDKEEDILKLETPIGGVTDIVRQALEILAAINRTPAVKLLGISPSGFNATGESDIRNYYDHILSQQEKVLRPAIKRILDLVQIRMYGSVDKSITFDFAELSEADQAAVANTQKVKADTMAALLDRNIVSPEECRQRLADDPDSGFADIDADDLPEPPEGEEDPMSALMGGGGEKPHVDDVDKAGALDAALDAEQWITVNPHGSEGTGQHVLIEGSTGEIKAGLGGKFNGRKISKISGAKGTNATSFAKQPKQNMEASSVREMSFEEKMNAARPTKSLNGSQQAAIDLYRSASPYFLEMNSSLRETGDVPGKHKKLMSDLDSIFQKASTREPMTLYRGFNLSPEEEKRFLENLKQGKMPPDKGYSSTSVSQAIAEGYSGFDGGVLLRIHAPKGSKAVAINPEEGEVLLPRNAQFKVKQAWKRKNYNGYVLDVEYIGEGNEA